MTHDSSPFLTTKEARQGTTKPRMRYVLAASLALIVIVFAILAMFYY